MPLLADVAHHPTFRNAALGLGLLEDDNLAWETLQDAVQVMLAPALRKLFVMPLEWQSVQDAKTIWECYSVELSDDFTYADRSIHKVNHRSNSCNMGGGSFFYA